MNNIRELLNKKNIENLLYLYNIDFSCNLFNNSNEKEGPTGPTGNTSEIDDE